MKVNLISSTSFPEDIMFTAARTCYSNESPIDIFKDKNATLKVEELIRQVLKSGHQSIAEHVSFTFAIEGISRACSHQLVRHRAGIVFSQQSQRYVEFKEDIEKLEFLFTRNKTQELIPILDKYFVNVTEDNMNGFYYALIEYLYNIRKGVKPEDARAILPNATKTNIIMTCNLRELIHICNLRLCNRAQSEIRNLFQEIVTEVEKEDLFISTFLVPSCEVNGFCTEHKCCGRRPRKSEIVK